MQERCGFFFLIDAEFRPASGSSCGFFVGNPHPIGPKKWYAVLALLTGNKSIL
jgi:hypothetical protein